MRVGVTCDEIDRVSSAFAVEDMMCSVSLHSRTVFSENLMQMIYVIY